MLKLTFVFFSFFYFDVFRVHLNMSQKKEWDNDERHSPTLSGYRVRLLFKIAISLGHLLKIYGRSSGELWYSPRLPFRPCCHHSHKHPTFLNYF